MGTALAQRATTRSFRLATALVVLAIQFFVAVRSGDRFGVPFNVAPGRPPGFHDPAHERVPTNWNRLVVSRWDSGQYIELGLRGYRYCPERGAAIGSFNCNLEFYPTYGMLGGLVSRLTGLAIDFSLLAISLVASFIFLFLWTGPDLTGRLGVGETYLALLLLNTYTTGYCLVTIQTEPLTLALALGSYVAFARRRHLLGALLAGATSGIRVTGVAVGAAYAIGLLVELLQQERPRPRKAWLRLALLGLLCGWGQLVLMAVHTVRFGDPLAYIHAHGAAFKHSPSLGALLWPEPEWFVEAIDYPLHEALWWAAALFWYLLGRRDVLARLSSSQRAFWDVTFWGTIGIATAGMLPIALAGMSRYLLLAFPLFFAMAAVMRPRPAVLAIWLVMSVWHYWNIDLCTYTGGMGSHVLKVCHAGHWLQR
ncbi:MAG TPA: hypothetical protein VMT03_07460 [Polyangia bacterium]|nr:hypothetical protein [Polyangia bacterium]